MNKHLSTLSILLICLCTPLLPAVSAEKSTGPAAMDKGSIPNPDQIKINNSVHQKNGGAAENEKSQPSIAIQDTSITRAGDGLWYWKVVIKSKVNRRVDANTAKIRIWQDGGGKRNLLVTKVYNRVINPPASAILQDIFFPYGESDSLFIELIETNQNTGNSLNMNVENIVDRNTVAMPPFGIGMIQAGYTLTNPGCFYAEVKNNSQWPILLRVVMMGGNLQHWNTVRHTENILLQGQTSQKIEHEWPFTEKGMGKFLITVETQLKNPSTGQVTWTKILEKPGNLPTNR